jgi:predicted nucleotidyltransferase
MFDFLAVVRVLTKHESEFIIVGGLAGVIQGAPIHTQDLDVLYSLEGENPERMLRAVLEIGATFFGDARGLVPDLTHMRSRGHKLLATLHGRVDCLATIEENTTYQDVANDVDWVELDGIAVRVLSLPRLIEVKKKLNRPKDQLALLQLEATLEERSRG